MSSRDELILQLLMLESGIIPYMSRYLTGINGDESIIDKRIASLEPQARRKVKRKFRKLWRKAARLLDADRIAHALTPFHKKACGLSCTVKPSSSQKKARRLAVILFLQKDIGCQ